MSTHTPDAGKFSIEHNPKYQPTFRRDIKRFASFAASFSCISITTGIFTTYGSALNWGGPLSIWTWPVVVLGQLLVALVFSALASRIPIAGYSYQWASRLANPKIGWLVGWISLTFLLIVVVTIDYALAQTVFPSLFNYEATPVNAWIITSIVIFIQAVLIVASTLWSTRINNAAVLTEVLGIVGLTLLMLIVGALRGGLHFDHVFSTGTISPVGYFSLGTLTTVGPFLFSFLLGAYTIVGFESAANLVEETEDPLRAVPFAMWFSVFISGVIGLAFLVTLNLASGDIAALTKSSTPVADIVTQTLGTVVGDAFLLLVTFSIFACGLMMFITATRLVWAMSRDERFPLYQVFQKVDVQNSTPRMATILCGVVIEGILAAFAVQTNTLTNLFSAATLLPVIIYLITVILYLVARRKLPQAHGFQLGAFEWPVVILALVWLIFELSIFRDASFLTPWLYLIAMLCIGLVYFFYMLFRRPTALRSSPFEEFTEPIPGQQEQ